MVRILLPKGSQMVHRPVNIDQLVMLRMRTAEASGMTDSIPTMHERVRYLGQLLACRGGIKLGGYCCRYVVKTRPCNQYFRAACRIRRRCGIGCISWLKRVEWLSHWSYAPCFVICP